MEFPSDALIRAHPLNPWLKRIGGLRNSRRKAAPTGRTSSPLTDRHVIAFYRASVDLTRTIDASLRIRGDLAPVRNPARRAADGEDHREHVHRHAERAHDDAAV